MPSAWKPTEQIVIPCTQEQKSFDFLNGILGMGNNIICSHRRLPIEMDCISIDTYMKACKIRWKEVYGD